MPDVHLCMASQHSEELEVKQIWKVSHTLTLVQLLDQRFKQNTDRNARYSLQHVGEILHKELPRTQVPMMLN